MTAAVTSGFSAAATPALTGGSPAAGKAAGDGPNLFAALLALLGPQPGADAAGLPEGLPAEIGKAAAPLLETAGLVGGEAEGDGGEGKARLKDLGAALIAMRDGLEDGGTADPALEHNLDAALDALTGYLEAAAPLIAPVAAPADTTNITLDIAAGAAPSAAAGTVAAPVEEFRQALADSIGEIVPLADAPPRDEADTAEAADAEAPALPEPLRRLVARIEELAAVLKPQAPELAGRLEALARTLAAGELPPRLAALLGADGKATDPEIDRILNALATSPTTKPAPVKAAPSSPFTAPTLELPGIAKLEAKPAPEPVAEPEAPPKPEPIAKPELTARVDREVKGPEAEPKPPAAVQAPGGGAASALPAGPPQVAAATAPVATTEARAVHAAYQAPVHQVNLPQVAFEVARQFEAGNSRFQIRLDPPELGRIDVKLDLDKSGSVHARMTVERPETLDLMQRDQRALQQALQQAGLDAGKTSLEFSLRQNPFAGQDGTGEGRGQGGFAGNGGTTDSEAAAQPAPTEALYRGTATAGGVNLFV